MDRNTVIGLVLIFVILIGFGYLNSPSKEERETMQRKSDSLAQVRIDNEIKRQEAEKLANAQMKEDTALRRDQMARLGAFASAMEGEKRFVTLENEVMRVKVSTLGGRIYSVELKDYTTYSGKPLVLFSGEQNTFGLQFWGNNNDIQTRNLYFVPDSKDSVVTTQGNPQTLTMRLQAGENAFIDYVYTIHPNNYMLDFNIRFKGLDKVINGRLGSIDLLWDMMVPQLEKGAKNENNYTNITYHYPNDEYEELSAASEDSKKEITTKLKWIDFKHQFFSSILVAGDYFTNANLRQEKAHDGEHLKHYSARISLPFLNGNDETLKLNFYFGPNHFKTLKKYNLGFEKVIPLGRWIIRWINRYVVIPVFDLLENRIASYGLIIFILTLLIKIVLFPLTYKSYLSSAKMRVLKPQVDEINAKYPKKEDALKKQQAIMGLYKKVGVNPMGGCIPILIQFPILIAMFRFFPASIELRQEAFLWADDLSSYDSILSLPFEIPWYGAHVSLFTLLMAGALFITSKMNTDQMGDPSAQMPGMKFMMTYMMPIMMVVWFNSYSSGLSYYYFLSNMFTLGQTYLIRRFVDDKEILAKLHENAKKPVVKSRWQAKLEEMAKRQQEMQKRKK